MGGTTDGACQHHGHPRLHLPEPHPPRGRGPDVPVLARRQLQPHLLDPGRWLDHLGARPQPDPDAGRAAVHEVRRERREHHPRGLHERPPRRVRGRQHLLRAHPRGQDRASERTADRNAGHADRTGRRRPRLQRCRADLGSRRGSRLGRPARDRVCRLPFGERSSVPLRGLEREDLADPPDHHRRRLIPRRRRIALLLGRNHARSRDPDAGIPLSAGRPGRVASGGLDHLERWSEVDLTGRSARPEPRRTCGRCRRGGWRPSAAT